MAYNIADELGAVHASGKLGLNVIALANMDARQIRPTGSKDLGADQIAVSDEIGDLRPLDQLVKDIAQPAPVASARRCRKPDELRVWIGFDQLAIGASWDVMRLVDDQNIGWRPFASAVQSLDRGDLHPPHPVERLASEDHAGIDAEFDEFFARLAD